MNLLPNIQAAATVTQLNQLGNANGNGTVIDLMPYKGPVTFLLAVGQSSHGVGNIDAAPVQTSDVNTAANFTNVSGGTFTPVINSANASNAGVQALTFDVRGLSRYARVPLTISGTNANVPVQVLVIGQKERV